jgi:hypothetical protein
MRTCGARTYGIIAGLALAGVSLLASTTWAGQKKAEVVIINAAARYAQGSLATARSSVDVIQSIGCTIRENGIVTCSARNGANTASLNCTANDPGYRAAVQSLNGDSKIYFSADAAGSCTSLIVENSSVWAPKEP